jgi:hypothetical protein
MSLINFKEIDFDKSINKENKIINFNGSEIQIINYLPVHDKYELIMATIKKSYENEIYNPIKLDMYFNLHLIYMYTNIVIDTEDKVNQDEIYDIFKSSGLLAIIKENMDQDEWQDLKNKMIQTLDIIKEHNASVTGFLSNLLNEVMNKVGDGLETLKNVDPEILSNILKNNPQLVSMMTHKAE